MPPPMDVEETDQGYHIRLSVPGFNPENLEVIAQPNTLTIRGEVKQEETEQRKRKNLLRREIRTEAFERNVTFDRPLDPDNITVSYENGILELDIPAREEARARHISVTSTKQTKAMGTGQTEQAAQGGQTTQQQRGQG